MAPAPISDNLNQLELPTSRSQQLYFAVQRPASEFFSNSSSYSLPSSLGELASRIRRNLNYFLLNYGDIVWLIIFVSSLWHPASIIVILWAVWRCMYLRRINNNQVVVMNRSFDKKLVVVAMVISMAVSLTLTGVWLYAVIGLGIVVLHATFRISEDLFLDEEEAAAEEGGLLYVVDIINDGPSPDGSNSN